MKLAKKLTCTALAACTALSLTAGVASAIDVGDTTVQPAAYGAQDQVKATGYITYKNNITPRDPKNYYTSDSGEADGPYWKLWVYNNASTQAVATIVDASTGEEVVSKEVAAYSSMEFRYSSNNLLTKDKLYYLRLTTSGGDLTGSSFALKASTNPDEVANEITPDLEVS